MPNRNAAAQRVMANAKILRDIGYEVSLVGMTHDGSGMEPFVYEGFQCVNLPYPKSLGEWWRMLTSIRQYLPYYSKETSIVIAYNHPAIALRKLLKYNRKRGIVTLSDCTEWYEPQGGWLFRKIKGWDVNQRMYNVQCQLDGVITISRYLDVFYKEHCVKTLLLPPLVDKNEKKWTAPKERTRNTVNIMYAGSPGGAKDRLDWIINGLEIVAANTGSTFGFDVIGITEQQYRKVYLVEDSKLIPGFVHFYGRLPHEKVVAMLLDADFQIFLREDHLANRAGFPTKFAETISAGTIALTNASSNLKDYMEEGVNSFEMDISSQDALVATLTKPLSMEKEELMNIQERMDTTVFDYRNYIEKTKQFLQKMG